MEQLQLPVYGMKCGKCVAKVKGLLEGVAGVEAVEVVLEEKRASVRFDPAVTGREKLESAITGGGFSLTPPEPVEPESGEPASAPQEEKPQTRSAGFRLQGMTCANCARTVETVSGKLTGVARASVNFAAETLQIDYDPQQIDTGRIVGAIADAGYRAIPLSQEGELHFPVRGMTCANCAGAIEKTLQKLPGVESVAVNLAAETVHIRFDDQILDQMRIFTAVEEAGYHPVPPDEAIDDLAESRRELRWLIFSASLSLPIMPLMMTMVAGSMTLPLIALLSTIVQWSAGITFYRSAWKSLRNHSANMDVLVAMGISAAYGWSLLAALGLFGPNQEIFFETSAMLITFIRFGKWLEARAKGKASAALKSLLHLQADTATRMVGDQEEEIAASAIRVEDHLKVRTGETIPADGIILSGNGTINEAMLTGESLPVEKGEGDEVTGGTINENGVLIMRATRIGRDTVLSRIVRMVEEAQADKAPIQRLADRVSTIFVPGVVLISLLTFALWSLFSPHPFLFAFKMAVAVLVIACPCALGLATPTAIMVGSALGLNRGILFKRASALEGAARISCVLFDKTGTLTEGVFRVTDLVSLRPESETLPLFAGIEQESNHPLARALVAYAQEKGAAPIPVTGISEQGGFGLSGIADGKPLFAGNQRLMEREGVRLQPVQQEISRLAGAGRSLIFLAQDKEVIAIAALADEPKEGAAETIAALKRLGIQTAMVTGDRKEAAQAIGRRLDLDEIAAEVLPGDKLETVRRFQERGHRVAMVGDGINDAPALAQADLGIAIGSGTEVAKETGDLVLVRNHISDVVRGIRLGRKTLSKIKQNLFWAFFYNIAGIPIAAGLLYPAWGIALKPEYAGLAMAFSSVSVVTSSLLLRRFGRELDR